MKLQEQRIRKMGYPSPTSIDYTLVILAEQPTYRQQKKNHNFQLITHPCAVATQFTGKFTSQVSKQPQNAYEYFLSKQFSEQFNHTADVQT